MERNKFARVAQWIRALACGARGRVFEFAPRAPIYGGKRQVQPPYLAVWGFFIQLGIPKVYLREKRSFWEEK